MTPEWLNRHPAIHGLLLFAAVALWGLYDILKLIIMSIKKRFALMSLLAMISVISFFHIDSYVADQHKINYLFWLGGFAFAALAIWNLAIIIKQADRGPED